ncbi:MAG: hybrid sensor histidine kinase/response regulator, partial [Spirochaetales bacterium]
TRSNTLVPVEYFEADLGEEGKVISLTDARLREEYERELLRAAREADENARARARFLSNVSHELRTPLNSIMGMTDLALDIAEDERQREYLEIVREAGHSLLGLISSILHYTRTDSTNEPIESVSVDLLLFCEEIVEAVSALRTNSSVRVGFQLRGPLPRFVRVDRRSLRQILLSIASNAVKFTGKGNAVLSVEIDESFSYLLFRIRDEGPGIPEQELERIFEPFSRSEYDDRESERGSGVGLSIAESLAHRIGAEIRVESKVGVGSDFTVRVPVEVEEGASLVDGLAGVGSFSSVEIASDDPIFTECVSSLCALGNMSVVTATGSRSATSLESDVACDIIVVDGDREYAIERVGHLEYRPRMVLVAVDKDSDPTSVLDAIPAVLRESTRVLETPLLPTSFYALIAGYAAGGDREGYSNATLSGVATTVDSSRRSEPSPDEAHSAAHRGMPGTAPVSKRILIAEDEAVNRLVNRRVLERFGHEVETAVDGNECIRVLAEKEVDLIVMDLRMPELNGIEAARKIRAGVVPGAEDTPIVALTAYALESERAECLAVGMNGFIGKPFSSQELYDAVEQYANHPIVGGTKHPSTVDAESSRLSTSHTASNFMTILQRVSAETDRERLKRLAADVSAGRRESFSRMDASELMFRLTLACRRGDISNAHDLAEQLLKMAEVGEL